MHPCDRPRLVLVAAVASNGCIGYDNDLPWHLPEDLKHFKSITQAGTVLLGRKTYESIVQRLGRPLPGRHHLVLSRNKLWQPHPDHAQQVQCVQSLDEAIDIANTRLADTLFVIGGMQLYEAALSMADIAELTEVQLTPRGDAFFPSWGPEGWENSRLTNCRRGEWQLSQASGLRYRFLRYLKPKVNLRLGATVLLAGFATRFGGQPKALLENQQGTILNNTVRALLSVGVDHVCLVHGTHTGALVPAVDGLEVQHIQNPNPSAGQSESQRLGLTQLGHGLDGYMVCLGDQPSLNQEDLRRLICAYRKRDAEVNMVYPESPTGNPGNPVMMSPELRNWFVSQDQAVLGKDWRTAHPNGALAFLTCRPGFFVDIDSEEDLKAFNANQDPRHRLAKPFN
ncbi:MAG: dihydrofolate reductase [Bordetella sp.]